ncbi:alpha/beta hydrolase [Halomonas sp. H10-59]|uniref:Alpha/beta hydrolase n=1 Tax=Halomonas sp. H10-59 TaxID=2950874 RepID=A0AAU7KTC3_9GAMM
MAGISGVPALAQGLAVAAEFAVYASPVGSVTANDKEMLMLASCRTALVFTTFATMLAPMSLLAQTVMQEHRIKSSVDDAIELYVRERLPDGVSPADMSEAVLFVHGATYPGISFDTDLADGKSWMDHTAEAGFATYYLDQRGYGNSTRPEVMAQPSEDNAPFARAETVIDDMEGVIDFIRERTGVDRVNLVGWSWGTVTSGMYTARNDEKVDRLVLFAPVYSHRNQNWTSSLADANDPGKLADVGAYRTVNREQADQRWANQIPPEALEQWRDRAVFDRWFNEMLAMEPAEDSDVVKAPNGVLVDLWEIFNARPIYEASRISVPTLVIRGDDDPTATDADARGLFAELAAEEKRYVVIGEGSHFLNLEKHAPQLFAETLLFLGGGEGQP